MGIAKKDRPKAKLECLRLLLRSEHNAKKREVLGKFIDVYLQLDKTEEEQYHGLIESILVEQGRFVSKSINQRRGQGWKAGTRRRPLVKEWQRRT